MLALAVDEDGEVVGVEIVEPAGHGFDEVAAAAAWTLRFEPARDQRGRSVAAEIRYAWTFTTADVPPLSATGVVRERGGRRRIAGATVEGEGPDGGIARTVTDGDGAFRLAGLSPGVWHLTVRGGGLTPSTVEVEVPAGDFVDELELLAVPRDSRASLDPAWDDYVEVVGQASVGGGRRIDRDEVATMPGSLGDPLRAVQNLPGVARAPFGSGQLLVRGTGPEDTTALVDGLEVPVAFHFSGISTVVNADLLDEIVFHPGNWSARYGRSLGGVVDLVGDDAIPDRTSSYVAADLFQATAFIRQRLGEDTALTVSARRSYVDAVLGPILAATGGDSVRAPRFFDGQARLVQRVGRTGRLTATWLSSDDRFRVLGDGGRAVELVRYDTSFHKAQLRWVQPMRGGWRVETGLMAGPERRRLTLTEPAEGVAADLGLARALIHDLPPRGEAVEDSMVWALRHEWSRATGRLGVRAGVDLLLGDHAIAYGFGEDLDAEARIVSPAVYLEPRIDAGPVQVTPGVRVEEVRVTGQEPRRAVDPRLTARFVHEGFTLTGGVGRFSQTPPLRELLSDEGSELALERALHASLGAQQDLGRLRVGLTGYRHWYDDLVVGREGAFRFDNAQLVAGSDLDPFASDGVGGAVGVEASVRYRDPWWTAWLSATVGRAWRIPRPHLQRRPARFDQPVILTALASRELPSGFRLGARARLSSGAPMTDVAARIHSVDTGAWIPVHGETWGARTPVFFALDTRIDREFVFRSWRLSTWIELQNATNRRNVEIPGWSADFSRFEPVVGLPVLPAFGLKGEW